MEPTALYDLARECNERWEKGGPFYLSDVGDALIAAAYEIWRLRRQLGLSDGRAPIPPSRAEAMGG